MFNEYDEFVKGKTLTKYRFRFKHANGRIESRDVYATDDEQAAALFHRVYFKEGMEILSSHG